MKYEIFVLCAYYVLRSWISFGDCSTFSQQSQLYNSMSNCWSSLVPRRGGLRFIGLFWQLLVYFDIGTFLQPRNNVFGTLVGGVRLSGEFLRFIRKERSYTILVPVQIKQIERKLSDQIKSIKLDGKFFLSRQMLRKLYDYEFDNTVTIKFKLNVYAISFFCSVSRFCVFADNNNGINNM